MILGSFVRVLILVICQVDGFVLEEISWEAHQTYLEICSRVTVNPFLDHYILVGRSWRVYYTWNTNLENMCLDMSFKTVNPLLVNRIRNTVQPYLELQPDWNDAALFLVMSPSRHILLLHDKSGTPGRFIQIPHIMKSEQITMPSRQQIKIYTMAMKLIRKGLFLILSDCSVGVTFLLARPDVVPSRKEVAEVAASLNFGIGVPSCMT